MSNEQHILQNKYFSHYFHQENFYATDGFNEILKTDSRHQKSPIRILMIGDIVGRCGRKVLKKLIPKLKNTFKIDFIAANAENIAGGFGITEKTYLEMNAIGIDALTMGNHWQDKQDIHTLLKKYKNIVLPQNLIDIPNIDNIPQFRCESKNKTIHIINLMGQFAMKAKYSSPMQFLQSKKDYLTDCIKQQGDIVIADIHAEGNSEKQGLAWFYDGICAAMIGTHTHTSTSDERILTNGTAFLTDVGMTGAYESVTGMKKERVLHRMCFPEQKCALEVSEKEPWFCGFLVDVDPTTSLAQRCARLQCRFDDGMDSESWFVSGANFFENSKIVGNIESKDKPGI